MHAPFYLAHYALLSLCCWTPFHIHTLHVCSSYFFTVADLFRTVCLYVQQIGATSSSPHSSPRSLVCRVKVYISDNNYGVQREEFVSFLRGTFCVHSFIKCANVPGTSRLRTISTRCMGWGAGLSHSLVPLHSNMCRGIHAQSQL